MDYVTDVRNDERKAFCVLTHLYHQMSWDGNFLLPLFIQFIVKDVILTNLRFIILIEMNMRVIRRLIIFKTLSNKITASKLYGIWI